MFDFLLGTHEFLGNHSFPEFIVGYLFGAALIIGAPTVFLLLAFVSALMKTNGKMGGYREYETYGESSLNDAPPFFIFCKSLILTKLIGTLMFLFALLNKAAKSAAI